MDPYAVAIRKYFIGDIKNAIKNFMLAAELYAKKGEQEKSKEVYYCIGKILLENTEDEKWRRNIDTGELIKRYVKVIIYFKLAEKHEEAAHIIRRIEEIVHTTSKKCGIKLKALLIFLKSLTEETKENLLDEINNLLYRVDSMKIWKKKGMLGPYILALTTKNLLTNRKETAKILWIRNRDHLYKSYKDIWNEISLLVKKTLGI